MTWDAVLAEVVTQQKTPSDVDVSGVQYDSRRVGRGEIFVAMRGGATDGNNFIEKALQQGAVAIVTDSPEAFAALQADGTPCALVEHGRRALSEVAAAIYGHPERKLKVSAVTGTNGKTTTAYLLEQILTSAGRKCVLIGTIETRIAGVSQPSVHTTPEPSDLMKIFADGVAAGCTEVVMEMSSHALEQERVWGVPVDVAIFTNLTQDHLDFHGSMEAYAEAKKKLFSGKAIGRLPHVSVINLDDPYGGVMEEAVGEFGKVWPYGKNQGHGWTPDFLARNIAVSPNGASFEFLTPSGAREINSPLFGWFNVDNLMAAMVAALARGMTLDEIADCAATLRSAPGRFELVSESANAGFAVVVDYAHTDDALGNVIAYSKNFVKERGGRVITLFGCGGDRDRTKRPKMGHAAGEGSDYVVVTSDNPRSENPNAIIEEVLTGLRETNVKYVVEPDRRKAIELAIREARPGDIVLLAGKGHEKTQTFADGAMPFDDVEEAARVLREWKDEVRA